MNLCALKSVIDRLTDNYITDIHRSQEKNQAESKIFS